MLRIFARLPRIRPRKPKRQWLVLAEADDDADDAADEDSEKGRLVSRHPSCLVRASCSVFDATI